MQKSPDAFRTISEVADWLDTPAHVLRFWESRFTQIKPIKRAGGRRYYRPADMALLGGIKQLLHDDGMTIRGVQKLLREQGVKHVAQMSPEVEGYEPEAPTAPESESGAVPPAPMALDVPQAPDSATDDAPKVLPFARTEIRAEPLSPPVAAPVAPPLEETGALSVETDDVTFVAGTTSDHPTHTGHDDTAAPLAPPVGGLHDEPRGDAPHGLDDTSTFVPNTPDIEAAHRDRPEPTVTDTPAGQPSLFDFETPPLPPVELRSDGADTAPDFATLDADAVTEATSDWTPDEPEADTAPVAPNPTPAPDANTDAPDIDAPHDAAPVREPLSAISAVLEKADPYHTDRPEGLVASTSGPEPSIEDAMGALAPHDATTEAGTPVMEDSAQTTASFPPNVPDLSDAPDDAPETAGETDQADTEFQDAPPPLAHTLPRIVAPDLPDDPVDAPGMTSGAVLRSKSALNAVDPTTLAAFLSRAEALRARLDPAG